MTAPRRPNARGSADFVHDEVADSQCIQILNMGDDCSRLCVGQLIDLCIFTAWMARWLSEIIKRRDRPRTLVLDNSRR